MYKNLRIAGCIVAALFAAAAVFTFIYAGIGWGFLCVVGAIAFYVLTVFFKNLQEAKERKDNPPPPVGDFITGKVPSDKRDDATDKNQ